MDAASVPHYHVLLFGGLEGSSFAMSDSVSPQRPAMIPSMQSHRPQQRLPLALLAATTLLFASGCKSQGASTSPSQQEPARQPPANPDAPVRQSLSLGISTESFQANYRRYNRANNGFWGLEGISNDQSDLSFRGRIMRTGDLEGTPLSLGIGFGTYAVFYDDSGDDLYALAFSALGRYTLPTKLPTHISFDVSAAPEVTTFGDGKSLLDFTAEFGAEVSKGSSAFIGFRYFDADTDNDSEFTHQLLAGMRLGI